MCKRVLRNISQPTRQQFPSHQPLKTRAAPGGFCLSARLASAQRAILSSMYDFIARRVAHWRKFFQASEFMEAERKLIVGLGNPGASYEGTRHNVGFEVVDVLARRHGIAVSKRQFKSLLG